VIAVVEVILMISMNRLPEAFWQRSQGEIAGLIPA
jgi:hypothetical protein